MGRTEELAALTDAFDAAADGLVVVLIGGDPGVGKTALADAFSRTLRSRKVPVHWGSCVEIGGAPAFWPWVQILRSVGEDALEAAQERLAARTDEPFPAFQSVHEVLLARSQERRVVVLDDLHRADLPSLELLRYLATAARELPILVVGTHRLHELRNDRARDVVLAAVGDGGRRLQPASFGLVEVRSLLATEVDGEPDPEVAAEVLARSGGNALYVEQLVDAVVRGGPDELAEIPDGIRAAVRSRLDPLPEATRDLLATASVLGPDFRYEVLAAVAGASTRVVRERLAPAISSGLVGISGANLAFTHALIRDTLDDELDPVGRSEAHAVAAAALAARADAVPAVVAQHLLDAGDQVGPAEVARWAAEAAAAARRIGGHLEAARWSEEAARASRQANDLEQQGEHLTSAVSDWSTVGDGRRAVELSVELAELARRSGSGRLLAKAALARSDMFEPTSDLDAPPLLREALAHPDLGVEPGLRADLLCGLAASLGIPSVDGYRRDTQGARAAIAELADLAAAGDVRSRARLAGARLNVQSGPLHHRDRFEWLAEYQHLLTASSNVLDRIKRLYWATSLAFESGELPDADRSLREWELLADRSASVFWTWRAAMARASLSYAQGRLGLAEEQAVTRADLVAKLHPDMAFRVVAGLLFSIRRDQGRLREIAGLDTANLGVLAVLVAADLGDRAETRRLLKATVAALDVTGPDDLHWLCLLSVIAVAAEVAHDEERCRWAADQLDPYLGQCVVWGRSYVLAIPVSEAIGIARRGAGQPSEAADAFRHAIGWADRVGAVGFGARARMGLASVLAAGDPERVPLVVEARATAGRLDMAATVAEAEALLGAADLDVAEEVVADLGVAAPVAVSARVRTLGRFEVVGAGCEDPAHWSSRKARDALKIMICRRGRAIPREELIDQLWPNVTLSVGRSRLSVVLSLLRVALDPERRFASDPLRADRQCVALDLDLVAVDVEELLVHAAKGLSSARQADPDPSELEEAARLAELGSFLAEDPYADFAVPLRATVERTHRDVLRALTQVGVRSGDAAGASRWLARLVELDPDDPLAHDALAAQLEVEGRFGAAD